MQNRDVKIEKGKRICALWNKYESRKQKMKFKEPLFDKIMERFNEGEYGEREYNILKEVLMVDERLQIWDGGKERMKILQMIPNSLRLGGDFKKSILEMDGIKEEKWVNEYCYVFGRIKLEHYKKERNVEGLIRIGAENRGGLLPVGREEYGIILEENEILYIRTKRKMYWWEKI